MLEKEHECGRNALSELSDAELRVAESEAGGESGRYGSPS